MAGHSKWAQIKRQKGVTDVRRGALFTKLSREITIAARQGGGDPDMNFRLRLAVQKARENNMPADNIDRAIKRATGGGDSAELQEITYEGYGPHGVAILLEAATDNRNRTAGEVRSAFTRGGGSLGETGSVGWQFDRRGVIVVNAAGKDPDEVSLAAIDAGFEIQSAELAMVPKTPLRLEGDHAAQVLRLLDRLEDLDDVQNVYSNADFAEEALAAFSS